MSEGELSSLVMQREGIWELRTTQKLERDTCIQPSKKQFVQIDWKEVVGFTKE